MSADFILETEGLTKEFSGFAAVGGVDLRVKRGNIHALIGPNGAGKTTCFNLLTKFLSPTRGRIVFKGQDITAMQPADVARLGLVRSFQISAVFPHMTVLENVRIALQRLRGNSMDFWRSRAVLDQYNDKAMELIADVGLAEFSHWTAVELPYGRKRALEIATTLALDPEMLLLDEPTAGMGHEDIERISQLIKRVSANRTVLMVEHNLSVVADLSDTITVLTRGRVLAEGNRIAAFRTLVPGGSGREDGCMTSVLVYGAYGHTGRFVVAELRERGFDVVLSGRNAAKLQGGRPASVDDPAALDRALDGAAAVINCAGPFAATAGPVIEAALRAGDPLRGHRGRDRGQRRHVHGFADRTRTADGVPAMAFFGGLGDLLVTAAMGDWTTADEAHIAYGLSSWHPTPGTRAAGRVSRDAATAGGSGSAGGGLEYHDDALPTLEWAFPEPLGPRAVIGEFTMADVVTSPVTCDIPEVART